MMMLVSALIGIFCIKRGEVNSKLSTLELVTLKQPARCHLALSSSFFTFGFVYFLTGVSDYDTALVAFVSLAAWECGKVFAPASNVVVAICGLVGQAVALGLSYFLLGKMLPCIVIGSTLIAISMWFAK